MTHRAVGFGVLWASDIALDGFDPLPPDAHDTPDIIVARVATFAERGPGRAINAGWIYRDGVRFGWNDEVAFDMIDGDRIHYLPGRDWRGALPLAFYSTVAALTLAWRGAIPFHACMVEVDGRAVLIAGPSGAGKSSLAAGLIGIGARLVADDLSVVHVAEGQPITVVRGRPTMRQHRETAIALDADLCCAIPGDPRDKWLVRPRARTSAGVLPLGGILALTDQPMRGAGGRIALLATYLFRPRWLAALPDHLARRHALLRLAASVPIGTFPPIATFDPDDRRARGERALTRIRALLAPEG